ncbi:hypothetical protein AB0L99_35480 [Streptomyces sp. NPDC051954]
MSAALPWTGRRHGRTVVIESGGTAMVDDDRIGADAELRRTFEGAVA